MLRTERIFEPEGIAEELEAYNPLIPDGSNLKATLLIEYADPDERARRSWSCAASSGTAGCASRASSRCTPSPTRIWRARTTTKTSAVHFLRFEFTAPMIAALTRARRWRPASIIRNINTASIR